MKPGDLVEFKAGLHGITPPNNYGIFLERVKRKEGFYAVLFTVKGKREIKSEHLRSRKLSARLEPPFDDATLNGRLQILLKDASSKAASVAAAGELRDAELWRSVSGSRGPYTPRELAAAHASVQEPSPHQIEAARQALEKCRRPGVGYFELVDSKRDAWAPVPVEAYKAFKRESDAVRALRKRLIIEEQVQDDPHALPRTVYKGADFRPDELPADDRARLKLLAAVMEDFILHDSQTGTVTVPGTGLHTLDGFSLFDFARWLATDWTGSRASVSSVFVEFLVDAGFWTEARAVEAIAKRRVLAVPSFGWGQPERVEAFADRFPRDIPGEWLSGREDLRQEACYTIDPPDAKDFDDAVGYRREAQSHVVWVHIADVSHYVEKGDPIDVEGRKRGTSVYLPGSVLPMLPSRLSEDLCSLRASGDRLAMSVRVRYDASGDVVDEHFCESVIRVTRNLDYGTVDGAIARGEQPFAGMDAFARLLHAKRRGLALDTGERRITLTPEGIVDPAVKEGSPATRMIEAFMVAANEAVARHLTREGVSLPYRCHPLPDRVMVEKFNAQLEVMELPVRVEVPELARADGPGGETVLDLLKKGKLTLVGGSFVPEATEADAPTAATGAAAPQTTGLAQLPPEARGAWLAPFREALERIHALPDPRLRDLVTLKLLACLGRAFYTPRNIGHFGLGSDCYCHFTSPIRRYPDLIAHRMLRWLLRGRQGPEPHALDELEAMAAHDSEQGWAAEALERAVVDASMVFASRDEEYHGVLRGLVTGITKGGVFLTLPRGLEARLAASDIPGGPYSVDENDSTLFQGSLDSPGLAQDVGSWREMLDPRTGELRRVRLRLGDELRVSIAGRDYVEGRVSVRLAA